MAASMNNSAWLEWMENLMGGVSQPRFAATLPPDRYHCVLDELPLHLVPRDMPADRGTREEGPWYLNPACSLSEEEELPDFIEPRRELVSGFAFRGTIAWVRNAAMDSV